MLADDLKQLLASSFAFYLKAKNFHWNVEGPDFSEYHVFFDSLAQEVFESTDATAEYIRVLDVYAPGSLLRYQELSVIEDQVKIPRAELMFEELKTDNEKLLALIGTAIASAKAENQEGILNFLAERQDAHGKHNWMLRSFLKKARA